MYIYIYILFLNINKKKSVVGKLFQDEKNTNA